jgi:hypothetical protein
VAARLACAPDCCGCALLKVAGGRYFENCNETFVATDRGNGWNGVAVYAIDPDNAERLRNVSLDLLAS